MKNRIFAPDFRKSCLERILEKNKNKKKDSADRRSHQGAAIFSMKRVKLLIINEKD